MTPTGAAALAALASARQAEREQCRFYRALAAEAERRDDPETAERLNELLADEQHHFSRITARVLELGETVSESSPEAQSAALLEAWETVARRRELAEVERYRSLLAIELDDRTRSMIREILAVEERHAEALGGKWMPA
jgi:rubrerythrin